MQNEVFAGDLSLVSGPHFLPLNRVPFCQRQNALKSSWGAMLLLLLIGTWLYQAEPIPTCRDPLSGHLFVFFNRRGDRVKIMFWDRSGFCIWYKRLEQGVFRLPQSIVNMPNPEVEVADLSLILEGIDLSSDRRRKRFSLGTRQKK